MSLRVKIATKIFRELKLGISVIQARVVTFTDPTTL